jgi:hypothetical protein
MTRAAAGADCAPGHGLGGDLAADEGNGSRASRCPPALACCAAANLAHEQLVNTDKRERRPRRDHPPGRSWLGDGNVGGQARRAARDQQRPGQHPAALPLARVGQQRGRRGHDQPIHRQRRSAQPPTPAGRATRPACAYGGRTPSRRSAPASPRTRSSSTRSTGPPGPLTTGFQLRTRRRARIGFWVQSPLGHVILYQDLSVFSIQEVNQPYRGCDEFHRGARDPISWRR